MFFSFYGGLKFCWDFVSTFFVKTRTLEGCCYVLNGGDSLAPFKICLYLIYLYVYLSIRMYLWASVCRRTTSPKSIFRASRQMSATCPKKRYQKEKVLGEGTFGLCFLLSLYISDVGNKESLTKQRIQRQVNMLLSKKFEW